MRRVCAAAIGLAVVTAVWGLAQVRPSPTMVIGLDFPTLGWVRYDKDGAIRGTWGFNLGLGISSRTYTAKDGLQLEKLNFFWGWGTLAILVPYLEIGATYAFPMDTDKLFCVSAGGIVAFAGLVAALAGYPLPWWVYPAPYISFSFWL
ncbi:MAG: hypothetical protein QW650_08020 [Thermofilum sp.]